MEGESSHFLWKMVLNKVFDEEDDLMELVEVEVGVGVYGGGAVYVTCAEEGVVVVVEGEDIVVTGEGEVLWRFVFAR
jgi:hypothetical protein